MRICACCAQVGPTCCQDVDILLTDKDLSRIAAAVGRTEFHEFRLPQRQEYLEQEDDPNWNGYATRCDGARLVLKRAPNGDCVFLTPTGCVLPMETRPLICRLHPFTYNEQGITGVSGGCPSHLLPAGESLFRSMGVDLATGERWRSQLYAELASGETGKENRTVLFDPAAAHPPGRVFRLSG